MKLILFCSQQLRSRHFRYLDSLLTAGGGAGDEVTWHAVKPDYLLWVSDEWVATIGSRFSSREEETTPQTAMFSFMVMRTGNSVLLILSGFLCSTTNASETLLQSDKNIRSAMTRCWMFLTDYNMEWLSAPFLHRKYFRFTIVVQIITLQSIFHCFLFSSLSE